MGRHGSFGLGIGVPLPFHSSFGPPLHCRSGFGHPPCPRGRCCSGLAVLGRPSAPWPGVPAPRVPQVPVLTPCRARGLCWPPRVPAPARHLGGQAASAWVRASRASAGRLGLLGQRPVWQTASSPSGVHASSCYLALPPDRRGGPAVFIRLCPLSVRLGGVDGVVVSWAVRTLGVGCIDDRCFVFWDNA
jgi:hypothetical protein